MFSGHKAYLNCIVNCIKELGAKEKYNMASHELIGMLCNRGLEFRRNNGYENIPEKQDEN